MKHFFTKIVQISANSHLSSTVYISVDRRLMSQGKHSVKVAKTPPGRDATISAAIRVQFCVISCKVFARIYKMHFSIHSNKLLRWPTDSQLLLLVASPDVEVYVCVIESPPTRTAGGGRRGQEPCFPIFQHSESSVEYRSVSTGVRSECGLDSLAVLGFVAQNISTHKDCCVAKRRYCVTNPKTVCEPESLFVDGEYLNGSVCILLST